MYAALQPLSARDNAALWLVVAARREANGDAAGAHRARTNAWAISTAAAEERPCRPS